MTEEEIEYKTGENMTNFADFIKSLMDKPTPKFDSHIAQTNSVWRRKL